jgi:hypothetical protein
MMLMRRLVRLGDRSHLLVLGANLFLLASIFMLGALPAIAAEAIIVPVHKVKIVKLDRDASVVLVANPTIADVAVESERLIFLFGLEPGETSLTILDADGEEILVAPVVVVPLVERQVTVNRASSNEEATYSCAPRCAAVATPAGTGSDAQETGSEAGQGVSEEATATAAASAGGNVSSAVEDLGAAVPEDSATTTDTSGG